ncbi:MAG TPA: hypothetical protein VM261_01595 [Kofleriaceae bacterium]|nr:hypothetical protein [Kofleriaceae bacterium]
MPLVRLLLPVIAAIALLVQPVATWAAAGVQRDLACCCPDPDKCECHDHDGKGPSAPSMRKCDNGQVKLVTPVVLTVDVPPAAPVIVTARPVTVSHAEPVLSLDDRTIPPEKPPF